MGVPDDCIAGGLSLGARLNGATEGHPSRGKSKGILVFRLGGRQVGLGTAGCTGASVTGGKTVLATLDCFGIPTLPKVTQPLTGFDGFDTAGLHLDTLLPQYVDLLSIYLTGGHTEAKRPP